MTAASILRPRMIDLPIVKLSPMPVSWGSRHPWAVPQFRGEGRRSNFVILSDAGTFIVVSSPVNPASFSYLLELLGGGGRGMATMIFTIIFIIVTLSSFRRIIPLRYSSPLFSPSFPHNMACLLPLGPPSEEALILLPRSLESPFPPPCFRAPPPPSLFPSFLSQPPVPTDTKTRSALQTPLSSLPVIETQKNARDSP